jgi:aspartate 1-decarboxylase
MNRIMLQAKLHRVRVTAALLDYEGSCGIDEELLDVSGIVPNQKIDIYNVTNGERFSTYAIRAPRHSGEISLNGAAARKVAIDDCLIICAYSSYNDAESIQHKPIVVLVNADNRPREVIGQSPVVASVGD